MCEEIELLSCVGLDYEWGESPVVDDYAVRLGYPKDKPMTFIGVVDGLVKAVSFIAAFPDGSPVLFKDIESVEGNGGFARLKRVLESDYLIVSGKGDDWLTSSEKPIPLAEELQESAIRDFGVSQG